LSISYGKPSLSYLLGKVKDELEILELGVNLSENEYVNSRFFLISAVFDKPARSSVLNIIGPTGYCSCLKCLQTGKRIKTENGGSVHTFPLQTKNADGPKRTMESYEKHLKLALKTKKFKFGIKDECVLSDLTYFHPIRNTLIDSMHSISLGVLKSLFTYWFEHPGNKKYSLKNKMFEIDDRLKRIRPPSYVPNAPRTIFDWKLWRAHEYMSFFLLYALMVFYNLMDIDCYNNLIKLVIFLELIFSQEIQKINLLKGHKLIKLFLKDITNLYDQLILKSGFHELLHLSELTLDFGPLNCTNCFPFEEINRKITGLIKGQNLIGEEFIKLYNACQHLASLVQLSHENTKLEEFIKKHSLIKTSNSKNSDREESIKTSKIKMKIESTFITTLLNETYGHFIENLEISQSIYYKDILYTTKYHEGKFGNFSIYDHVNKKYGIIWNIIIAQDEIFLFCNEISFLHCPFFDPLFTEISSQTFKATYEVFIIESKNMENKVSNFNNKHIANSKVLPNNNYKSNNTCQKQKKILEDIENLENQSIKKSIQDFSFIQYNTDSSTNVVKSNKILLGNNKSLCVGKGSRKECEDQSLFITSYENVKNPKTKPIEKELSISEMRTLSQSVSKSSITVQNRSNSLYETKISELELALKEKDIKISNLEKRLKKEEQINEAFRNTYKPDEIPKMVEFSLNFAKLFAKTSDLCEIPLYSDEHSENYYMLSKKHPNITIQAQTKHSFDALLANQTESDTKIFRRLIIILIPEIEFWAKNCKQLIKEKYNDRILAAFEYIQNKRRNFKISSAESEVGSLTAEARRKLKEKGYEFSKVKVDNKNYFRYEIVTRPEIEEMNETNEIFVEDNQRTNDDLEESDKEDNQSHSDENAEMKSNEIEDDENLIDKRKKKRKSVYNDDEDD
ncbi:unnamed protein product, partial [Brachionus calyciflorus]